MKINNIKSILSLIILLLLVTIIGCENTDYRESPRILRTAPAHNEISVSRTPVITITFSEDIDPATISKSSIHFEQNIEASLSLTQNRVTMIPQATLDYETIYSITVTTDIRDRGGKQLEQNYSWSFTTVPRPPFITSISPDTGTVGTIVNIYGFGFAKNSALNTVRFNGTLAEIISSTPTQIVTSVPLGATSGPIKVSSATGNSLSPTLFRVIQPGLQWSSSPVETENTLRSVSWAPPRYVAVGDNGTILTSTSLSNWIKETAPSQHTLIAAEYKVPNAYAVGTGGAFFYSRIEGEWLEIETELETNFFDLCMSSGRRVVVGANGIIISSYEGQNWTIEKSPVNEWFYGITRFKSYYYAVGSNGVLISSPDGRHWTERDSGTKEHLLAIDTSASLLIAVGYYGTILTSSNGNIWTIQASNVTNHLTATTYTGKEIIVVGDNGCILFSEDGDNWELQTSPTDKDLYDITWSGTHLVAVGEDGTILVSQ